MVLRIVLFTILAMLVAYSAFCAPCDSAGTLKQQYVCTRYTSVDGSNGTVFLDLANVQAVFWTVDKQVVTFYVGGQMIEIKGNATAADLIIYYRLFLNAHPEFLSIR